MTKMPVDENAGGNPGDTTNVAANPGGVDTGKHPVEPPKDTPAKFLKDGKLQIDDLVKSYVEIERLSSKKIEDLRAEVAESLKNQPVEGVPKDAASYTLKDLSAFGVESKELEASPLTKWWRETAFAKKLSQADFDAGLEMYAKTIQANFPDPEAEKKKLGENADTRLQAVAAAAKAQLSEDEFKALAMIASTANGVTALEKLFKLNGPAPENRAVSNHPAVPSTVDELRKMQNDPRYYDTRRREPAFVKLVEEGYAKLYGKT